VKLRDRIGLGSRPKGAQPPATVPADGAPNGQRPRWNRVERAYQDLKLRIHRELIERIDLATLARTDLDQATAEMKRAISQLIEE